MISYSNFHTYVWQPLIKHCGLDYQFHSLRHAAASLFIEQLGWSPKRIQAVLGHSSITMTYDRYGHLFENKDDWRRAEAAGSRDRCGVESCIRCDAMVAG